MPSDTVVRLTDFAKRHGVPLDGTKIAGHAAATTMCEEAGLAIPTKTNSRELKEIYDKRHGYDYDDTCAWGAVMAAARSLKGGRGTVLLDVPLIETHRPIHVPSHVTLKGLVAAGGGPGTSIENKRRQFLDGVGVAPGGLAGVREQLRDENGPLAAGFYCGDHHPCSMPGSKYDPQADWFDRDTDSRCMEHSMIAEVADGGRRIRLASGGHIAKAGRTGVVFSATAYHPASGIKRFLEFNQMGSVRFAADLEGSGWLQLDGPIPFDLMPGRRYGIAFYGTGYSSFSHAPWFSEQEVRFANIAFRGWSWFAQTAIYSGEMRDCSFYGANGIGGNNFTGFIARRCKVNFLRKGWELKSGTVGFAVLGCETRYVGDGRVFDADNDGPLGYAFDAGQSSAGIRVVNSLWSVQRADGSNAGRYPYPSLVEMSGYRGEFAGNRVETDGVAKPVQLRPEFDPNTIVVAASTGEKARPNVIVNIGSTPVEQFLTSGAPTTSCPQFGGLECYGPAKAGATPWVTVQGDAGGVVDAATILYAEREGAPKKRLDDRTLNGPGGQRRLIVGRAYRS